MNLRLILLIDFSKYSETVLKLADAWGQSLNARLLLVHQIVPVLPGMLDVETKREMLEAEKEKALQALRHLVARHIKAPLATEYLVTEQNLSETVSELTLQPFHHMVILGLKGAGFLTKMFIGSTASSLLEDVNVLTVAVPETLPQGLPHKLVVALHAAKPLNEKAFDFFLQRFASEIQQVEFLSINKPDEPEPENKAYLQQVTETYRADFQVSYHLYTDQDAANGIDQYMTAKGPDHFLVVQKGPRSVSDKLFRSFLIDELLKECNFPLIILPE